MSLEASVTKIVAAILDRLGIHFYKIREYLVSGQNQDGTLELRGTDADDPGLSNVKLWGLTPGSTQKISGGCRCLVVFRNGLEDRATAIPLYDGKGPQALQFILESADLQLGGAATEKVILGDTFTGDLATMLNAISADATASASALSAAGSGAVDPLAKAAFAKIATTFATLVTSISQFNAKHANQLSTRVKVKK